MTIREFEESTNDKRLFYRLPKKLFEDSAYGEMTTDAKMLYMLLLDRRCLSDMNGDEWSAFAEFLGNIIAKYSDEVRLDDLPDPHVYIARKNMEKSYKYYMEHVNERICKSLEYSIEYVFC